MFYDTQGDDHFRGTASDSRLWGDGYSCRAKGFKTVQAFASRGTDDASLIGVAGDVREDGANWTEVRDPARTHVIRATNFDSVAVSIPASAAAASGFDPVTGTSKSKKAKPLLQPVDWLLANGWQW